MAVLSFREALCAAMVEEMERDSDIFLLGEEVAEYDGAYKVSKGMLARFGPNRVVDAPISEGGFAGLGVGAAMAGLRPIIEMMTWNFGIQAFDQIINHAAKIRYMSAGQFTLPIVFRGPNGAAHMLAAQHSQSVESLLCQVPGLKVVSVSTPADGKGLLKTAIRDDNPVIFLESEMLYGMQGEVPEGEHLIPFGSANTRVAGSDVAVFTWGRVSHKVVTAAEELAAEGISCEVVDLRSLQPLDRESIFAAVRRLHRAVVVEESWPFASVGAEIVSLIQEHCFDDLDAPVLRVSQEEVPVPYAEHLEAKALPGVAGIKAAVKKVCYQQ